MESDISFSIYTDNRHNFGVVIRRHACMQELMCRHGTRTSGKANVELTGLDFAW
jgi:hypothetical protein